MQQRQGFGNGCMVPRGWKKVSRYTASAFQEKKSLITRVELAWPA
jgi:hypothetical protein